MDAENINFKNKKVLVMGLGNLGGGVATARWFVKHGAKVTVTDLHTRHELADSIRALGSAAKKITFALGKHRSSDFKNNDLIAVNPAVPRGSRYLAIAKSCGVRLENEASLFLRFCKNPVVGVTGTRGKTTTVNWIHHFLKRKCPRAVLTGNSSEHPMLKVLDTLDGKSPVVVEFSSWHCEFLPVSRRSPHIAVITNIYADHLNRYGGIDSYAASKANIFRYQTKNDLLILNKRNLRTTFFVKKHKEWVVKSKILYSYPKLPINEEQFAKKYGAHNLENLKVAWLAAEKMGVPRNMLKKAVAKLPGIPYREEKILNTKNLTVINDSAATSPDATIAALKRFTSPNLVLITGGTDKNLPFGEWAKVVKQFVKPQNLFLLDGSATKKMVRALMRVRYFKGGVRLYSSLPALIEAVKEGVGGKGIVLFSPSAASFEKFKNEFDRGKQFNVYSKQTFLKINERRNA